MRSQFRITGRAKALKIWVNIVTNDDRSKAESDAQTSRLNVLLSDAREIGCENALRKHNHDVEYLTAEKRRSFLNLIKLGKSDDVLEIGSSMGQHSIHIAKQCRHLEAFEVVAGQAEFAKVWCEQSGAENVNITVGGVSGKLPYADSSFDVVIMNYVLEWCAGRSEIDADEFHRQYLTEICRVLKPGGRLFLTTKNRYGLRLLTGSVDEHLGIRFGSALPRWLSHTLSRSTEIEFPKGHLHSRKQLSAILSDAGFASAEAYLSFPDARWPDLIVPFDDDGMRALKDLDKSQYSKKDQLFLGLPNGLKSGVATSHTFVASKKA